LYKTSLRIRLEEKKLWNPKLCLETGIFFYFKIMFQTRFTIFVKIYLLLLKKLHQLRKKFTWTFSPILKFSPVAFLPHSPWWEVRLLICLLLNLLYVSLLHWNVHLKQRGSICWPHSDSDDQVSENLLKLNKYSISVS